MTKDREREYSFDLDLDDGNILHGAGCDIGPIEIINTSLFAAVQKYIVISIKDLLIDFQRLESICKENTRLNHPCATLTMERKSIADLGGGGGRGKCGEGQEGE